MADLEENSFYCSCYARQHIAGTLDDRQVASGKGHVQVACQCDRFFLSTADDAKWRNFFAICNTERLNVVYVDTLLLLGNRFSCISCLLTSVEIIHNDVSM